MKHLSCQISPKENVNVWLFPLLTTKWQVEAKWTARLICDEQMYSAHLHQRLERCSFYSITVYVHLFFNYYYYHHYYFQWLKKRRVNLTYKNIKNYEGLIATYTTGEIFYSNKSIVKKHRHDAHETTRAHRRLSSSLSANVSQTVNTWQTPPTTSSHQELFRVTNRTIFQPVPRPSFQGEHIRFESFCLLSSPTVSSESPPSSLLYSLKMQPRHYRQTNKKIPNQGPYQKVMNIRLP